MFKYFKKTISLLNRRNRFAYFLFVIFRILLGILDLIGIAFLGILLSNATKSFSAANGESIFGDVKIFNWISNLSLIKLATIVVIMFVSKSILSLIVMRFMALKIARIENEISGHYFDLFLKDPLAPMNQFSKQEINYAFMLSPSYAITKLLTGSATILSETTMLVAIIFLFSFVDLKITIGIVIYFLLIGGALNKIVGRQYVVVGKNNYVSTTQTFETINDSLDTLREISAMKKQGEFSNKYRVARLEAARNTAILDFLGAVPRYIVESALMVGALTLAAFTFRSNSQSEAAGLLGIFVTGGFRIMASMLPLQTALGANKQIIEQGKAFFEITSMLDSKIIETGIPETTKVTASNSERVIGFSDVDFTYPGSNSQVISGLSFEINKGEFVAFIGPSGSGKSTIADLIIGLLKPESGSIEIDSGLKSKIGYVPQSPGITTGTISTNVSLNVFSKDSNSELLKDSLNMAHILDFVLSLEDGPETDLGSYSESLSGGQMQRIGLARAIYSRPNLLILDEATSALDVDSEAAVSQSLNELRGTCTIIVIAHRLSTVQNADKVFVIDEGKIVAEGKFADLAKSNELVARYVELSGLETN